MLVPEEPDELNAPSEKTAKLAAAPNDAQSEDAPAAEPDGNAESPSPAMHAASSKLPTRFP